MSLESILAVLDKEASVFITGTDTDAGKTFVSERLLNALSTQGLACAGFKPISAGCEQTSNGLRNDDAMRLNQVSSIKLPYELVNPIAYEDPVAPHLAAEKTKQAIDFDILERTYQHLIEKDIDLLLVEGAGGWQLPLGNVIKGGVLSEQVYFMPDFVASQNIPVILVVGMKLGCLNHALLSYQAIRASGCRCLGWVANQLDPQMDYYQENVDSLTHLIDVPMLAEFKYQAS